LHLNIKAGLFKPDAEKFMREAVKLKYSKQDIDIATQIKMVDWLKTEILEGVATLFKALLQINRDAIADALSKIIIFSYLLGHKIGINFNTVDDKIISKLENSIQDAQGIAEWSNDLIQLKKHINKTQR
jgi:hypothetical protein